MKPQGPTLERLLGLDKPSALAELERLSPEQLLDAPAASVCAAELVRAALYLHHGELERCHRICQGDDSPNGSYWHGIMHRHEGDLGNSKYWYRRAGPHPVLTAIGGYPQDPATEQREFDLLLAHTIALATGRPFTAD